MRMKRPAPSSLATRTITSLRSILEREREDSSTEIGRLTTELSRARLALERAQREMPKGTR